MEILEKDIITKLKNKDESGLRQIFDLYYTPLCVYSLKYIDSFEQAEDIVQNIFIDFWEKKRFNSITQSLRSYLFSAVKNNSLLQLKQDKKILFESLEEQFLFQSDEILDIEEIEKKMERLYQELEKLPLQGRKVFEAIVFDNNKYKEVAQELDISVNTVKTHFSRSLKQLRSSLEIIIFILLP